MLGFVLRSLGGEWTEMLACGREYMVFDLIAFSI